MKRVRDGQIVDTGKQRPTEDERGWMNWLRDHRDEVFAAVFLVFYAVGTAGHYVSLTRPIMLGMTPYFLLIFGVAATVTAVREEGTRLVLWGAATYMLTFAAEAIGVATGLVFGAYDYGQTLGLHVLGVPLVIGFNWVIVVAAACRVTQPIHNSVMRRLESPGGRGAASAVTAAFAAAAAAAVPAALIGVVFDVLLEPVAMHFDYWDWEGGAVPLRNYAAWFVVGFVPAVAYFLSGLHVRTRVPAYYLAVQAAFFAALLPAAL